MKGYDIPQLRPGLKVGIPNGESVQRSHLGYGSNDFGFPYLIQKWVTVVYGYF